MDYKDGSYWSGKEDKLVTGLPFSHRTIYRRAAIIRARDQKLWIMKVMNVDSFPRRAVMMNILDVGSGQGGALRVWRKHNIIGLEPDPRLASLTGAVCGTINDYDCKGFDLLLLSHVLEHLNLELFFKKANHYLWYGGLIFVEVPCCDNREANSISRQDATHKHHFTMKSLEELFVNNGYEVIFIQSLISKIDRVTKPGLTKHERLLRVMKTIFTKHKSTPAPSTEADVIRLIARKKK
jgi:hypothetical protein